jgi:heme oxygenase
MLSERLKEETKTVHQELEKSLIPKMKAIGDRQDYINLLGLFYSYFGGLEKIIDATFNKEVLPDYHDRRKTKSLEEDLNYFEASAPALATGSDLPEIKNHFQALGALYVIEGSTLGGQHITRMIAQQLDRVTHPGFAFFNGYKEQTDNMWSKFKACLDSTVINANQQDEVINAAGETFEKFKLWIRNQQQLFLKSNIEG